MRALILGLTLGLIATGANAGLLHRECTLDKAVKNEAMNATLGVKGNCDANKLVDQKTQKAKDKVADTKHNVLRDERDAVQERKDKVERTTRQVQDTRDTAKKIADDPVKAAATAVINK